ncbi:hypothetical protein DET49_10241 [Salegentibacter sp. 24]|jgi:hypothetical protein|uniref:hypothetical protein n=1 Tax=Salegentibacter sp. 24 TaxID=2183986 RepID=UPI00105D0027|nr:hypothetical protein [Salegentibacter sp. 24]TDN95158.1 hypothetical protein DET49_10241 [Salegentibacter sp. 24]
MKNSIFLPLFFCFGIISAQQMDGAWKLIQKNGEIVTNREVVKIIQDGYFALGSKLLSTDDFLGAAGGELNLIDETLTEIRDFDTYDAKNIGIEKDYKIFWINTNKIKISDGVSTKIWERVSDKTDILTGNWVITGRVRGGQLDKMIPTSRRTVKILSGNRFQWIAFNSATKEFHGSGGGTYTAHDGNYTENIEFFSRDSSRVGARLKFQFEVKDGNWHHTGKSSKGEPIYEIWSPYNDAYQK